MTEPRRKPHVQCTMPMHRQILPARCRVCMSGPAAAVPNKPPLKVLLCSPRGFCAGVVRAIETVEQALARFGAPVFVRRDRSQSVCGGKPQAQGGRLCGRARRNSRYGHAGDFLRTWRSEIDPRPRRERRNLFALDATCPLVTKVHGRPEIHHKRGREIVLIGHAGHPEVVGTIGQLPEEGDHLGSVRLGGGELRARAIPIISLTPTQTTLSVDDTAEVSGGTQGTLSQHSRAAQGRHLLRHHQPPGGRSRK